VVMGLLASVALASTSLQVVAEPSALLAGQTGTLHVMVIKEGHDGPELAPGVTPRFDVPPELDVRYRGLSQRFQSTGSRIVSVFNFQYALSALAEGTHEIDGVAVRLTDGTVIEGNPVTLTVQPRPDDEGDVPDLEVFARFDDAQVWEGQVALYHYGLTTSKPGVRATWSLPDFEGLRAPQHGKAEERQYTVQDGSAVITTMEGTVPFIATGTGTIDVPPARATVAVAQGRRSWGSRLRRSRGETRVTRPAELEVRPLPPPPAGFSGVVGEVVASVRLDRREAEVGDSVELLVDVRSDGSLEGMSLPAYEPDGASVYEDDASLSGRVADGSYEGVARFRRVLVPTTEGSLDLPDLELVTFSPAAGDYVTHRLEVGAIEVSPGREGSGEVQSFAPDAALDLDEGPEVVLEGPFTWGFASTPRVVLAVPLLLLGAVAPGAFTLMGQTMAWTRRRWRRRREEQQAGPQAPFSHLRALPDDPAARLARYDAAIRQALANRHGVSVGALDRDAAVADLPDKVADLVRELFRRLDRARYGGADAGDLETAVRKVIRYVEGA